MTMDIILRLLGCLIIPGVALFLLPLRWQRPWKLRAPLLLMRRAVIDARLLVEKRRMTAAHLPFEPTAQPRLQSGALLWASAATVTHTLAAEEDREAILAAVKPLGFTPEKFLARCPILGEINVQGLHGYVVRDGHGQRAYFIGEPAALLAACPRILEQQERDKTLQDVPRLPSTAEGLYGLAMAPVEAGRPGPLTYLGSVQIAAPAMDPAVVKDLLPAGWVLDIQHDGMPTPRNTLHIAPQSQAVNSFCADMPDWMDRLAAGFVQARHDFRQVLQLVVVQFLLAFAGAVWQLPPWLAPLSGMLLLPRFLHGSPLRMNARSAAALVWLLLWPVLIGSFIQYVAPGTTALMPALIVAALCMGTSAGTWKIVLPCGVLLAILLWLVYQPAALPAAFCLIAGALHGLIARWLCRLECS